MPSIKSEITKGVFWIAVAKYSGIFITLGITAILARNVSPQAFGTMAVATVVMVFLEIFVDMGIGSAIIQFKDLTKPQINSIFTVSTIIGVLLSTSLFFAAKPIANYYADNTLIPVCRLLCVCMLFNALNVVPNGLMLKDKRFKVVALRTLAFQIISGAIAIWGALHGWGIYALIVTPIVTSIGVFSVNYYNYPQRFFVKIDFQVLHKIWGFSSFQFLFSFINYFSRNLDKLIIGKYFSMTQLGYYDKSYRLMQMPLQNITFVISPVLHPILSSLQDNKHELGEKNRKLTTILSYISFPIGIALFFCSHEIINIVFGPNWEPAVPVFSILALSLPLQIILSTSGSLFLSAGKSNHLFYIGVLNTIVTVAGFFIAAIHFHTISAMAWAWDITLVINFFSSYIWMNKATFGYSVRSFFKAFIPQVVNSLIVFAIAWVTFSQVTISNLFLSLLFKLAVVAILTVIIAYLLRQYNLLDLIKSKLRHHNIN